MQQPIVYSVGEFSSLEEDNMCIESSNTTEAIVQCEFITPSNKEIENGAFGLVDKISIIGKMQCKLTGRGVYVARSKLSSTLNTENFDQDSLIAVKIQPVSHRQCFQREIASLHRLMPHNKDNCFESSEHHQQIKNKSITETASNQSTNSSDVLEKSLCNPDTNDQLKDRIHALLAQMTFFHENLTDGILILGTSLGCGGTVTGLLEHIKRSLDPQTEAWFFAAELSEAVTYVHDCGLVHHDIKEENIFIQGDGHLMLGDFGLARALQPGQTMTNVWRNQSAHMPPEVHSDWLNFKQGNRRFQVSHSIDWFSVGVFLYVLLRRVLPFSAPLIPPNAPFTLTLPQSLPSDLRNFLAGLLHPSAGKRLGPGSQVLSHPWIRNTNPCVAKVMKNSGVSAVRSLIRCKGLTAPFVPVRLVPNR